VAYTFFLRHDAADDDMMMRSTMNADRVV